MSIIRRSVASIVVLAGLRCLLAVYGLTGGSTLFVFVQAIKMLVIVSLPVSSSRKVAAGVHIIGDWRWRSRCSPTTMLYSFRYADAARRREKGRSTETSEEDARSMGKRRRNGCGTVHPGRRAGRYRRDWHHAERTSSRGALPARKHLKPVLFLWTLVRLQDSLSQSNRFWGDFDQFVVGDEF